MAISEIANETFNKLNEAIMNYSLPISFQEFEEMIQSNLEIDKKTKSRLENKLFSITVRSKNSKEKMHLTNCYTVDTKTEQDRNKINNPTVNHCLINLETESWLRSCINSTLYAFHPTNPELTNLTLNKEINPLNSTTTFCLIVWICINITNKTRNCFKIQKENIENLVSNINRKIKDKSFFPFLCCINEEETLFEKIIINGTLDIDSIKEDIDYLIEKKPKKLKDQRK